MKNKFTVLLASSAFVVSASLASAATFSSYYAFGDSLTDQGQLGQLAPPSEEGRFSNGPTYAEILAKRFQGQNLDTGNLALGGATAGDVNTGGVAPLPLSTFAGQVGVFIGSILGGTGLPEQLTPTPEFAAAPPKPGDNPLVSVLFGANDIFQQLPAALATSLGDLSTLPSKITDIATLAANSVASNITSLNSFDSRFDDFAVINSADISTTPAFGDWGKAGAQAQLDALLATDTTGLTTEEKADLEAEIQEAQFTVAYLNAVVPDPDQGGALVPLAQKASFEFNKQLALALDGLDPSINIFEFDQPTFTDQFLATSAGAGLIKDVPCTPSFTEVTILGNCAFDPATGTFDNARADAFFFADNVHPSAPVQAAFGQAFINGIQQSNALDGSIPPVPLPAGAPLLLAGLGSLVWIRRLRRVA